MSGINRRIADVSPRFTDEERNELASTNGLTAEQLMWLERQLGVILDEPGQR